MKAIGSRVKNFDQSLWHRVALQVMAIANVRKVIALKLF